MINLSSAWLQNVVYRVVNRMKWNFLTQFHFFPSLSLSLGRLFIVHVAKIFHRIINRRWSTRKRARDTSIMHGLWFGSIRFRSSISPPIPKYSLPIANEPSNEKKNRRKKFNIKNSPRANNNPFAPRALVPAYPIPICKLEIAVSSRKHWIL